MTQYLGYYDAAMRPICLAAESVLHKKLKKAVVLS